MNKKKLLAKTIVFGTVLLALVIFSGVPAFSVPLPGGSLDPLTVPKFVTPLVIPPVMKNTGTANDYNIAVRQIQQQILPGGLWDVLGGTAFGLPPTTVWSYGPAADPLPDASGVSAAIPPGVAPAPAAQSQFNYPAFTVENTVNTTTTVDWINDLVVDPYACAASATPATDPACNFLPHLLPIDQTLHWANPPGPIDSRGTNPLPYLGPVPIITHVHGAHVGPESDGYPEAWYLPAANNIPVGYATQGSLVNQYAISTNTTAGIASFSYPNDQPSTTLWYHDHTLGMTRNNVYAGPAGFWLIRDPSAPVGSETGLVSGILPGPAPAAGEDPNFVAADRAKVREIPIAIQDRSFNADGSLFYPNNRAFFEGIAPNQLKIPFIGDPSYPSDISPIWNPEFFGNMMVVNGVTWPNLNVEPDLYRFRLLNGCNSRFLNLSLQALDAAGVVLGEVPFYQIGAEQSLLPNVVKIQTGFRTVLPGNGTIPGALPAASPDTALLMGLAERADVLVDFSNLPAGTTKVRMINTAPDAPFGGFPDIPADPATTGQVMEFTLVAESGLGEGFTAPENLALSLPDSGDLATGGIQTIVRDLALIEEESALVCVNVKPNGSVSYDKSSTPNGLGGCIDKKGGLAKSIPFAPKAAVLGTGGNTGAPTVTMWSSPIATKPVLGDTETWELYNYTVDGHPIHLHLVKFKVVNREAFDIATGTPSGTSLAAEATEIGWKDTVIAYPGQVTRLNATFDIDGLYVWHCHIVEHEDNEMMVPYCVETAAGAGGNGCP